MNIETTLKKDGIEVIEKLDVQKVNTIAKNIADKISLTFPQYNLDKETIFVKLCNLNMYKANLEEGMAEAKYYYKNSSIYFNKNISLDDIEEFAVHECIHFLQEIKGKKNNLIRMGLCDYSDLKVSGLAINEAAVQLMASKVVGTPYESVKYYGIDFSTSSPSYYPLECCLVEQMAYLVGEDSLFKSTLFSHDDFKRVFSESTSPKAYMSISRALDDLLFKEEKLIKLNNKVSQIDDRNKKVDHLIKKMSELKDEITITFLRTQNLIISSYFETQIQNITNTTQIEIFRKKLYNFRDYIGITDSYTYFDDFYLEKISELNHKANIIENGGIETAMDTAEKNNIFTALIKKIKDLLQKRAEEKRAISKIK